MNRPKYRAFLSYSHRDDRWAGWLHKSIESYRPPKNLVGMETPHGVIPKRLAPVFRDREELASATDLGTVISEALRESACQIVICSPKAAKSKWVNEEILSFKRLGRENRIFCLIVGGEPNATDMPGREDEECFPPALRFKLDANGDLSDIRTEPIAADARDGKDGKSNAKLKLIAGVLGVGFDSLRRREQQRRNRQLFLVACASLAGMVVTTGLAGYALVQRKAAERQTARAEAEAETARQTTNFMVDLFKISDPSEARGNTVTAREMLDKGAARIDRDLAKQPAIRATLMDTIGTVYMGLGLYGEARKSLDGAVATRRLNQVADPLALSVSLEHEGDLATYQADFDVAEKSYKDAIALQASRDDRQAQVELAKSLHGLGTLYEQKGLYKEADASLRDALERQHKLYGATHAEIARTQQDLARVISEEGDLNGAIPMMRAALALQRELRGSEPHPDVATVINELAVLLAQRGDNDEAEKLFRESIAMYRRLLGEKHPAIAISLGNLAQTLQDKGDLAGAESTFRQALAMQRELLGDVHPDVAAMLNDLAFVQYQRGDTRGALATERESLAVYQKLFPGDHPEVARVMNRIGFWLTLAGQYAEADKDLQVAFAMRRRLVDASHPDIASSLMHLAILQVAQRKYDDALVSSRRAIEITSSALSPTHWKTAVAESAEGAALTGLGQYSEAAPLLKHSLNILSKDEGAPPEYRSLAQRYLDILHERAGTAATATRTSSAAPVTPVQSR